MTELKLYNTKEVAQMLSISEQAVRRYIREGYIEAVKIGKKSYGIPQASIEKLMDTSSKPADLFSVEPLITELEDAISDERRDTLTSLLQYANPEALERAISEMRTMKESYKGLTNK